MKRILSCVTPDGTFQYGIHKPEYKVANLRKNSHISILGRTKENKEILNTQNLPETDVQVGNGNWIYEIPNPFPFRGRTFIDKSWADNSANNPARIRLPSKEPLSFTKVIGGLDTKNLTIKALPRPLQLTLATCSTDPEDLIELAGISCKIIKNSHDKLGLEYTIDDNKNSKPVIFDHVLFEAVANNPALPDSYKIAMVIRPGAQGGSEIVGEYKNKTSHVYEYLRRNSYISGGHYAANMAEDSIRYTIKELTPGDMHGLRHLYYQRTFVRLAADLNIETEKPINNFTSDDLEDLRLKIIEKLQEKSHHISTLWGWNFGFDYAPSGYRLHASHQQIHQQFSIVPDQVESYQGGYSESNSSIPSYGCGDLIADWITQYESQHNSNFFADYRRAILSNRRMDERPELESDLVIWQDKNVMLFVPKAQTSQWEVMIMTLPDESNFLAGNIIECTTSVRNSLDKAILKAQQALARLGANMVTTIEFPKRIGQQEKLSQPLIYSFLPKVPESPGAFSEAQLRYINGHYPEDFARVCRDQLV